MVFKENWEKSGPDTHISTETITALIEHALPNKALVSYEIISGGCINVNIKLILEEPKKPLILRIYLRDPDCCYNEQKIASLLHGTVPVPEVYSIHDFVGYRYALVEFIPGITLRTLLLNYPKEDSANVVYNAGILLGTIQKHHFNQAGFFDKNFTVIPQQFPDDYVSFLEKCIHQTSVINTLGQATIDAIQHLVTQNAALFPNESDGNLVHGDYDPANILVDKINGQWQITAILDWEFAFSGSWLWDVSNMLRYTHQVPKWYEASFLKGLEDAGLELPENWRMSIKLLNLLSLLDILTRCEAGEKPCKQNDIVGLIKHIISSSAEQ